MVYVNGVLVRTDAQTGTINAGDDSLAIGALSDNEGGRTAYWEGMIDHVLIYNRALTAGEIQKLYREPFCMYEEDSVAMMYDYSGAPAPTGQVIMISTVPIVLLGLLWLNRSRNVKRDTPELR